MDFVLSRFILILLVILYPFRLSNMLFKPDSDWDNNKRSSADIMQPTLSLLVICTGSFLSALRKSGRSDRNILNNNGLRIHPCLTPWLTSYFEVLLLPILTAAISCV